MPTADRRRSFGAHGADPFRQVRHAVEQRCRRAGQVDRRGLQQLARVAHAVGGRFLLALRVDQQPARQVERRGVGQQLIQVGVGDVRVLDALVLHVAGERAVPAVPPRQVGLEPHPSGNVQRDPPDLLVGAEHAVRHVQRVAERPGDELLEDHIHVDQEARRADAAALGLERPLPQDEARQRHDAPVMPVQPVEYDLRHRVCRVLDRRHGIEARADPRQAGAGTGRADAHPRQPRRRRLHQPIRRDVIRELIVLRLQRQGDAEPAPNLLVDADAAADRKQRFLFRPIPVQQTGGERPARGGGQLQRQYLYDVPLVPVLEPVVQRNAAGGVGRQEQHARDRQLGPDRHRQAVDFKRADGGARRQVVDAFRAGRGVDDERSAHDVGQRIALTRGERDRFAPLVFPQIDTSHSPASSSSGSAPPSAAAPFRSAARSKSAKRSGSPYRCSSTYGSTLCSQIRSTISSSRPAFMK